MSRTPSELGEKLQDGIDRLEPDLRAAVVLRDVQGLSNAEAASAFEITVAALKSRLHRARLLLRKSWPTTSRPTSRAGATGEG